MPHSHPTLSAIHPAGRILVVGDVMLDVIVKPEGPLIVGSDRKARIEHHPGGSASNQAAWLASLGSEVALLAKVGKVDFEAQSEAFVKAGVVPLLSFDEERPSGAIVTIVDNDGQRSFFTDRGANDCLDAADFQRDLLEGVSILHVSGYALFSERPRKAVLELIARASSQGVFISVDPGSAGFIEEHEPGTFFEWTRGASICFPNEDEARALTGAKDIETQRATLTSQYEFVVLKKGRKGAEVCGREGNVIAAQSAPRVDVIDTTGAGDAFLAGFLNAISHGACMDDALQAAVTTGSASTTVFGGRPRANT